MNNNTIEHGTSFGCALAIATSYAANHSIGWVSNIGPLLAGWVLMTPDMPGDIYLLGPLLKPIRKE